MELPAAISYRDDFRKAREAAQQDAENFEQVAHALENLGAYLCATRHNGLGKYRAAIKVLACNSPLASPTSAERSFHTPFDELYRLVTDCRNSAAHEGVFARNLTQHAIQIAIVIEDALIQIITMDHPDASQISDFMIRNPICAEMWYPLSFIRQSMLANSFSFLPVTHQSGKPCHVISDLALASYLGPNTRGGMRKERLSQTLEFASSNGLNLLPAATIKANESVEAAIKALKRALHPPMLLILDEAEAHLLGVVMPFDLL